MKRLPFFAATLLAGSLAFAQNDDDYAKHIREYTTEPFFLTELVDHLPSSASVPSPLKHFGHIIGTPNLLHYVDEINGYMRALDKASPRVVVESMGKSEEGREMILVLISDEENLAKLERYKEVNALLGDPRKLVEGAYKGDGKLPGADEAAEKLIQEGIPFYYATAGMHSPESGPPEMVMELVYRLAVEESPMIQAIRKNSVVMITPVLDTDGRDRYVDTYFYRKRNPGKAPIPLVYWGKYVAHDNNRDAMAMSLALSRNLMRTWFKYRPLVMHDLHESVPFLYISTGTGPYNPWLDPITIDEWHILAYHEVNELTRRGVPGVWTHGFYDGWAANYAFYAANGHNAIGRFYETQGGRGADTATITVGDRSERAWYRPNPPYNRVKWSIRNNTNLMQSGVLLGLHHVATQKEKFLRNYYMKSKRSVLKPWNEGPAAYVLPADEKRKGLQARLLKLLQAQGVEVARVSSDVETKDAKLKVGDFLVRMDQPYSRMADMLLDKQYFNASDPRPYDDTGWTLGPLFNVGVTRVRNASLLAAQTTLAESFEPERAMLDVTASVADPYVLNPTLTESSRKDKTANPPRIVLVHTWTNTQDEGWYRLALDELGLRYKYVSVHELRDTPKLKDRYDVIILGPVGGSAQSFVNGMPKVGGPIPWKASKEYKHLGGPDTSNDIRGGIELEGMLNLKRFLDAGGLLICVGSNCRVPIEYGLVSGVSVVQPRELFAPGGVYLTERVSKSSPVMHGYDDTLAVYFNSNRSVLLNVSGRAGGFGGGGGQSAGRPSGRGDLKDPDVPQSRPPHEAPADREEAPRLPESPQPEVLLRFAQLDRLLVSGGLDHGEELAGKAALVRCPVGKGNVLLFAINPMWRHETMGSWSLILNAAAHWKNLDATSK